MVRRQRRSSRKHFLVSPKLTAPTASTSRSARSALSSTFCCICTYMPMSSASGATVTFGWSWSLRCNSDVPTIRSHLLTQTIVWSSPGYMGTDTSTWLSSVLPASLSAWSPCWPSSPTNRQTRSPPMKLAQTFCSTLERLSSLMSPWPPWQYACGICELTRSMTKTSTSVRIITLARSRQLTLQNKYLKSSRSDCSKAILKNLRHQL